MDQQGYRYMMESDEEAVRLDLKTDPEAVEKQALWAGIHAGMRVADLGCGSGKTTFVLNRLVGPSGSAVGIDISRQRMKSLLPVTPVQRLTINVIKFDGKRRRTLQWQLQSWSSGGVFAWPPPRHP